MCRVVVAASENDFEFDDDGVVTIVCYCRLRNNKHISYVHMLFFYELHMLNHNRLAGSQAKNGEIFIFYIFIFFFATMPHFFGSDSLSLLLLQTITHN